MRSSTNHEILHVLREQATWKQGQVGYARGMSLKIIASIVAFSSIYHGVHFIWSTPVF